MVTIITRTIKPTGGDYATPQDAYDAIGTIAGGVDLVALDKAVVFEMDAGTYPGFTMTATAGYVFDATRNVTFRAAEGQGHGGTWSGSYEAGGGVKIVAPAASPAIVMSEGYAVLEDLTLVARNGHAGNYGIWSVNVYGWTVRRCIISVSGPYSILAQNNLPSAAPTITIENVVSIGDGPDQDRYMDLRGPGSRSGVANYVVANCTALRSYAFVRVGATGAGGTVNLTLLNNFAGDCPRAYETSGTNTYNITGSGNVGGSTNAFPSAVRAGSQTWDMLTDFTTASDGNNAQFNQYTGQLWNVETNDALQVGTGPSASASVPTTDLAGEPRSGATCQPGAFESTVNKWTPVQPIGYDIVDAAGVFTCYNSTVSAVTTDLAVTGGSSSAQTPQIPLGTRALHVQLLTQTGTLNASKRSDVILEAASGVTVPLLSVNGNSGFDKQYNFNVDVVEGDGTYPRVKVTTSSALAGSDVVTVRVTAVGGGATGGTW